MRGLILLKIDKTGVHHFRGKKSSLSPLLFCLGFFPLLGFAEGKTSFAASLQVDFILFFEKHRVLNLEIWFDRPLDIIKERSKHYECFCPEGGERLN
jgi:hypothetical protein